MFGFEEVDGAQTRVKDLFGGGVRLGVAHLNIIIWLGRGGLREGIINNI